jgi:cell division protein FtsB
MPGLTGIFTNLPPRKLAVIAAGGTLALGLVGLAVLLRRKRKQGAGGEELDLAAWLASLPGGIARLTLKAQVENLLKDKAALQQALEEMHKDRDRLTQEKAGLAEDLMQKVQALHEQAQALEEVHLKVKVSQEESKAMQEEYMALYARSGMDKQALRKN